LSKPEQKESTSQDIAIRSTAISSHVQAMPENIADMASVQCFVARHQYLAEYRLATPYFLHFFYAAME
jgi:hypothetical protein